MSEEIKIGDIVQYASGNPSDSHPTGKVINITETKGKKAHKILIEFTPTNKKWRYANDYRMVEKGVKK